MTRFLSKNRIYILILMGAAVYILINIYHISLWWVVVFGALLGLVFGKVFCRWMCPIGLMMELMMKLSPDDSFKNMYQYHKIGCPIAWISGMLNKVSFYKIRLNEDSCKNCGLCDKACYMPNLDKEKFSLFKTEKVNPADNYSCSKCLSCVAVCPNGSLSYKPGISFIKSLKIK